MRKESSEGLFVRYEGNPILTSEDWPYSVGAVFNPGAIKINGEVLLLVRVEDRRGYSHLTIARSKDGKKDWKIGVEPALNADINFQEAEFGLEDPRLVWMEERQEYLITCVSFFAGVEKGPPGISIIATKDFSNFKRLGQQLMPLNKDACLFPKKINGFYAMINRPSIGDRSDMWVSFSPDLQFWGRSKVLLPTRFRMWDEHRIGLACPPIETKEGWLILYHGARDTASGTLYRIGLALLDIETLEVIRRSKEWVFGPHSKAVYEMCGNVDGVVFPCGGVIDDEKNELLLYYGAADSVIGLAIGNLAHILEYLKKCPA